ncbi:MAG: hypothetical protein NDJ89_15750 [Oligoflexia bacterium]|nr:hypothetical protein [Oligoflexia bacterium]
MFFFRKRPIAAVLVWAGIAVAGATALTGCSAPEEIGTDPVGKQAILDWVDIALSSGNCADAVAKIEPLLNSEESDNTVRMKAASAYACHAGINFFQTVTNISANSDAMTADFGAGFWPTMAKLFPSAGAGLDYRAEGAILAIDALQATLAPGIAILPSNRINAGSFNEGSLFATDRTSDANIFMIFNAMAAIGSFENRYGVPDPVTYKKTALLPWKTAISVGMDEDGCAYVSSIFNLMDSLGATAGVVPANLATTLNLIHDNLEFVLDGACAIGCKGTDPALLPVELNRNNQWVNSGCSAAVTDCDACPAGLRDRTRCLKQDDDIISCAAAGVVNFINSADAGWVGP